MKSTRSMPVKNAEKHSKTNAPSKHTTDPFIKWITMNPFKKFDALLWIPLIFMILGAILFVASMRLIANAA